MPGYSSTHRRRDRGLALPLVLGIVLIAMVIVTELTYSAQLRGRGTQQVVNSAKAEYILKSALNFARAIIAEDETTEDSLKDPWGMYANGNMPIPGELVGLDEPNITITVEIRPEGAKLPVRALVPTRNLPDEKWRGVLVRLFRELGFDEDKEPDQTGFFKDKVFNSEELVANLIDYMDQDTGSYSADGFASGIESELPEGYFPNKQIVRAGELATIPGFTPRRVQLLLPFVTVYSDGDSGSWVNLNLAPTVVLRALDEGIDENTASRIVDFRSGDGGPFDQVNKVTQLTEIVGDATYDRISSLVNVSSLWFQVIAKVEYGQVPYFLRAYLRKEQKGQLPKITSVELF